MDQVTLESRLSDLPLGGIRFFESLGSTNDVAAGWAEEGAADFSLVLADEQTAGRGRAGRRWFTYPGSALAFSLILRPSGREQQERSSIARLSGLGALGVSQTLKKRFALPSQIKWPNDVLLNRKKLCGILTEAHWRGDQLSAVILGIGVNVATSSVPPDDRLIFPATSLETELGQRVERISLLHDILAEILVWRSRLVMDVFLRTWEANLAYRDEWVQIVSPGQQGQSPTLCHEGHIIGLNPDGFLKMCTHSGEVVTVRIGEIPSQGGQIQLRPVDSSPK